MDGDATPQSHLPPGQHDDHTAQVGAHAEGHNTGYRKTSYTPVASSWNADQFNASLNANLLTFSVAPLTHVMHAVGTAIHHHDIILQDLAKQLHRLEKEQQQMHKPPVVSPEDLLAKLENIEKRVNDVEINAEETNAREELLTDKLAAVKDLEDRMAEQDVSRDQMKKRTDEINAHLENYATMVALDSLKESLAKEMQRMIKDALDAQADESNARFNSLQEQILLMQADNDDENDADILRPAHIGPAETTMETHTTKSRKITSMQMLGDPTLKLQLDQLDQQVKNLTTRLQELETAREYSQDQLSNIRDIVKKCDQDVARFQQDISNSLDDLATKASISDAPPMPVMSAPIRKYEEELQRQGERIDRMTKQLGELILHHSTDHETLSTSTHTIKILQEDLRKLKAELDEFQQNQSLMQGFTGSGGGSAPDLSLVFAKLAEMRQVQSAATEDLRHELDQLMEWVREMRSQGLSSKLRSDNKTQLALRQLDADIALHKESLQHHLSLQENAMSQVTDWLRAMPLIRKELEKSDSYDIHKINELQSLLRQHLRTMPSIASLQACTHDFHANLQHLRHVLAEIQDAAPESEQKEREEGLQALVSLLLTLEKHNESLVKQYDNARLQMDELWQVWSKKQSNDMDNKFAMLSKEITEVALLKPKAVVATPPPETHHDKKMSLSAQALAIGEGNDSIKRLEQLLLTCCRRLDGFEDDIRALSRNLHAYRGDLTDCVTGGDLSKLKFQIYAELAKIHAVLGSSKFQGAATAAVMKAYDDREIKSTLDMQAQLIASLCTELKKDKNETDQQQQHDERGQDAEKMFNAKLDSITEKVAEMFVSLEVQRSTAQPRNIIPAYNPTLLLEAFAQNIEAKLAQTQDLTKKDIERIKSELGDNVRNRVKRAMEAIKDLVPSSEATTSVGTIPGMVCCIACSRPVRFDTSTGDVVKEVPRTTLGLPDSDGDDDQAEREGDPEFVYRAGFRMPVNEKRSVLPLLVSPRAPKAGKGHGKSRRFVKGGSKKVDNLMREVDDLNMEALNADKQSDFKKAGEVRKPVPLR
ncbi:Neutral ceramidase [Aphanomyces cochlioides]|nr:Neutral ceramidase [Aphanomyces cochlioides]